MSRTDLTQKAQAAASQVLHAKGYISPVEVLMAMGTLTKQAYERWRFRQVPYLEKVLPGSLNKFQFFLRTLRSHARDELGLKASRTVYTSWGKGHRQLLRFSKYGNPYLEELYSTHYVGRKLVEAGKAKRDGVPAPRQEPEACVSTPTPERELSPASTFLAPG